MSKLYDYTYEKNREKRKMSKQIETVIFLDESPYQSYLNIELLPNNLYKTKEDAEKYLEESKKMDGRLHKDSIIVACKGGWMIWIQQNKGKENE